MSDPGTYQVLVGTFDSIAGEMQASLFRTGFSTAIRESHDASSALLTPDGRLLGQCVTIPTHMGAFPACAEAVLSRFPTGEMEPGDVFVLNDPYLGGSAHSPDVAVLVPAFDGTRVVGFAATMAHKTDLGSISPGGGTSQARDVFQEGLLLPPVRWSADLEELIRRNSRDPDVVAGDLHGQVGASVVGVRRFEALVARWGPALIEEVAEELFDRTELRVRRALRSWPDGVYRAEGWLDSDGVGPDPVRLQLVVEKRSDRIRFDFSGCDRQRPGPVNIRPPLVRACCYYGLVCCIDPELPNNAGLARVVQTAFERGTVLDPEFPAPVNVYVYTLMLAAELVLACLGQLQPDQAIACSGGGGGVTLAHETAGGTRVQYELLGAGGGARPGLDGLDAIQAHIVNCRTAPIEIIESEFPVRVRRFELRADSGGAGAARGGLGFEREYEILGDGAVLSTRGDHHRYPSWGRDGGSPGAPGRYVVNPGGPDERTLEARTGGVRLRRGDVLLLRTPGGGGLGPVEQRPLDAVRRDVRSAYVSPEAARRQYGTDLEA